MLKQKKIAGMLGVMLLALSSLSARNVKPNGCEGPVLCPSFPIADKCSDCCYSWHVDIGILYSQPGFADMTAGFAYSPVFTDPTANNNSSYVDQISYMLDESYDYSVGVTASLGHLLKHDNWYIGANFDWISAKAYSTYNQANQLYRPSSEISSNIFIESSFDMRYNTFGKVLYNANTDIYSLGVLLSRGAYISNSYSIEPFAGVKALWFSNTQNKSYQTPSVNAEEGNRYYLNDTQNNWGVGPMFGLNGVYHITDGLSIFSDNSVGVLYGGMNYNTETIITESTDGANVPTTRTANNPGKLKAVAYVPVRSILGIQISKYFLEDNHYVALRVGYDAQAVVTPTTKVRYEQMWQLQDGNANVNYFSQLKI